MVLRNNRIKKRILAEEGEREILPEVGDLEAEQEDWRLQRRYCRSYRKEKPLEGSDGDFLRQRGCFVLRLGFTSPLDGAFYSKNPSR